jgi:ribosomal protein L10
LAENESINAEAINGLAENMREKEERVDEGKEEIKNQKNYVVTNSLGMKSRELSGKEK